MTTTAPATTRTTIEDELQSHDGAYEWDFTSEDHDGRPAMIEYWLTSARGENDARPAPITRTYVRFARNGRVLFADGQALGPIRYGDPDALARILADIRDRAGSDQQAPAEPATPQAPPAPVAVVRHGDHLQITGARWPRQRLVTLSGYGDEGWGEGGRYDGPDGPAAYAEAAARNGVSGTVWLSAEASVIYSGPREAEPTRHQVAVGDVIRVRSACPGEGGLYLISASTWATGDNCRLTRV